MTLSKILSNLSRWPLFIAYAGFLYFLYTLPLEQFPPALLEVDDKVLHFLDFFLLALLAFRTFALSVSSFFSAHAGVKAAAFSLLYGAFLEWVQVPVPGREMSLTDWLANAAGVLAASGIFWISRLTPPPRRVTVAPAKNP